jgi:hypothetical protein
MEDRYYIIPILTLLFDRMFLNGVMSSNMSNERGSFCVQEFSINDSLDSNEEVANCKFCYDLYLHLHYFGNMFLEK